MFQELEKALLGSVQKNDVTVPSVHETCRSCSSLMPSVMEMKADMAIDITF